MKKKYYSVEPIKKENATFNIIIGKRSNGKSYAVREEVFKDCIENGKTFALIRRWREDIKTVFIEEYLTDLIAYISKNCKRKKWDFNTLSVYQSRIYLSKKDDEGNIKRLRKIGYVFSLTTETHYKSLTYPDTDYAIFEEFITDSGYLFEETTHFMSLISTIFRQRKNCKIYLIGNTISRNCPYFSDWKMLDILKQKKGTIEVYKIYQNGDEIKVAVEYCEDNGETSVAIGQSAKMINEGDWDTKPVPIFSQSERDRCKKWYSITIRHRGLGYRMELLTYENDRLNPFIYFYPDNREKINDNERLVDSDERLFTPSKRITTKFFAMNNYEKLIIDLLKIDKIVFNSDLSGTEYKILRKEGIL